MGLTNSSIGLNAVDSGLLIKKKSATDKVIALAGNPNVGKSTVFNALTGMNQHTGNWPGKTVANAQGFCESKNNSYVFVDIPGTYSLLAHSSEEEIARNFLCFGEPDAVVVVCDATCLERNLNLVLQTIEITKNTVVCVNLMDEAKRKRIEIDIPLLQKRLGVSVISTVARRKKSLDKLLQTLDDLEKNDLNPISVRYDQTVETAIKVVEKCLVRHNIKNLNPRWLAIKLLDADESLKKEISDYLGKEFLQNEEINGSIKTANEILLENGINREILKDKIVSKIVSVAEDICRGAVTYERKQYSGFDRKMDKILTSKATGYPLMILLLALIFWITVFGANYPSAWISDVLTKFQNILHKFFLWLHFPLWLNSVLLDGIYKTLAWVVSVMLPPMAIFFPLFTLLEDSGYLPRIAYNLDKPFKKCNACGKQSLTMCMGFGCNAAGVVGCRIIDSERERLLAILTNNFVPCNGRFPTLISLIMIFFISASGGLMSSVMSAIILTAVILLGIGITFLTTKILSNTLLKGKPSSFTLELPPYRKPKILSVIVRSVTDRTLFVLGRAAAVAAPAGLIIWIMANVKIGNISLLNHCAYFLDPFAKLLGLDGVILMAFILGFPANEIVIPIIIMTYLAKGSILELGSLAQMRDLFVANGWSATTALCMIIFSLFHWPCSTTVLTIKKETGSLKWTALSVILPTVIGMTLCFIINLISKMF